MMREADVFKMIKGCPAGKRFSFKHNMCIPKNFVCDIKKSEVIKKSKPLRSAIKWNCDFTVLSNEYDLWKGTANDFFNSELRDWFRFTNKPVDLHFTIGADVLLEEETPGLMGDYRSPPWCIPAGEGCYNRERLYEIAEEIKNIPIIDKKRKRLNSKLFGEYVKLTAWFSTHPFYYGGLRIKGNDDVYYLLMPDHVYSGPLREEIIGLYEFKHHGKPHPPVEVW